MATVTESCATVHALSHIYQFIYTKSLDVRSWYMFPFIMSPIRAQEQVSAGLSILRHGNHILKYKPTERSSFKIDLI
ncbi:unnamed protein product [Nesidiocoris tenuis]|uniref:Uncharacterized protein n=1 Tax=Nesidiocoris tenuis TaxID=355587 RepID=A0A6H5GLK1_9HEMI|nr:unnamed protein product [Nesidiocoris tenuis]